MHRVIWLAALAGLAGCSRILGLDDLTLQDSGISPPPPPPDAAIVVPPNTVLGRQHVVCHQTPANGDAPTDLSQLAVRALLPDDSPGGYRVVTGTGAADGGFRIDAVPDGRAYTLQIGTTYYVTDQHAFEIRSDGVRCMPPPRFASAATTIQLALTGMAPFSRSPENVFDRIDVASLALGRQVSLFTVSNGATSLAQPVEWGPGDNTVPLVDTAAGDDLLVLHLRTANRIELGHKQSTTRVVDWFSAPAITMQSGTGNQISGAFLPAPADRTLSFSIDRVGFDAGRDGRSQAFGPFVAVFAGPQPSQLGVTLAQVSLSDLSRRSDLRLAVTGFAYGDPFPAAWTRLASVSAAYIRFARAPGSQGLVVSVASHTTLGDFTGGIDGAPGLRAPEGVQVGGSEFSLGGKLAFDGTSTVPVVWSPVAGATGYAFRIRRVTLVNMVPTPTDVAVFKTAGTSLELPAELFATGQAVVFTLAAQHTARPFNGRFEVSDTPSQTAEVASGMFRVGGRCGDGAIAADEEDCDSSGESATCDVDCTIAECGDGLRNAARGEACDTALDTASCNSDCTLPRCGDGHINLSLEDCDDGDAVDNGNGCSAECKLNNVCGNGVTEAQAEACDDGGSDTTDCDADCTAPLCGDGHLNQPNGELCDDGNFEPGDGCTDCQP